MDTTTQAQGERQFKIVPDQECLTKNTFFGKRWILRDENSEGLD